MYLLKKNQYRVFFTQHIKAKHRTRGLGRAVCTSRTTRDRPDCVLQNHTCNPIIFPTKILL